MDALSMIFKHIDLLLFIVLSSCVCYLLFYAILSKFYHPKAFTETTVRHRFYVIFPAYKADHIIIDSISSFLQQDYPKESYEIAVVADQMEENTCDTLRQMGANVIVATYENSTKAKALALAMKEKATGQFDMVVIMDADNTTTPNFLQEINKLCEGGSHALQAHRTAKNLNTDIALLDAASEEINNNIFRKGHAAIGLSAGLSGSGMAFNFNWFKQHVDQLKTAGEDKEIEAMLLKENIFIDYLSWVDIYDEKTQKREVIAQQRRRWIAAQLGALKATLPDLPNAIIQKNFNYADKIVQWMLPPRLIQIGLIFSLTLFMSIVQMTFTQIDSLSIKWWSLTFLQIATFAIVFPLELVNNKMVKAILKVPLLTLSMLKNIFRLKGANKYFIHTKHERKP